MKRHFLIVVPVEMDADPPGGTHIRWYKEFGRFGLRQHRLNARGRVKPEGDSSIAMMIVDKHGEHPAFDSKSWRSPGFLFLNFRKRHADSPRPFELIDA